MASTLVRTGQLKNMVFRHCFLNIRQICVPVTAENKTSKSRKERRRKRKEEGMRTHAIYHNKVNELATKFRLKRLEEEKLLNTEQQKREDLRQLEKKTHDGVIESVNLDNKFLELRRYKFVKWRAYCTCTRGQTIKIDLRNRNR